METLTTPRTLVNFFRTDQKRIDWRFETSNSMNNKGTTGHKTIYWIGILDLGLICENQKEYPLNFISHSRCELREDREWGRAEDGVQNGVFAVYYDFTEILSELLVAKKSNETYQHLLIMERVDEKGRLHAYVLLDKEKQGVDSLSQSWLRSEKPWTELPTFKTAYLSYFDVSKLTTVCIRSTRAYNWQK